MSQKEIHQEIIDELKKFTCSESEAEDFNEWIQENNWTNYDGIDRWINTRTRKVVQTNQLYQIYARVHKN